MSFSAYPKYKDSGVEWLGQVPDHWNALQSRRLFSERKEKARQEDKQLTASQKYGVIYQEDFMALEGQKVVQVIHGADILKHAAAGDFVISMRSFQGGIELCPNSGAISSAYVPLKKMKHVDESFFRYLFKSAPYIQALQNTSNLVRDGQALRFSNFAQVALPVIPLDEQRKVAAFLDDEIAKINALVREQERLIELLIERKSGFISNFVTQGMGSADELVQSGVSWLGNVPKTWQVMPIKKIVETPITDGPHETPTFLDDGIPFVSAEAVSSGSIDFSKVRGFISESDHLRYSQKYKPKRNDIFMIKSGATTGISAIVDTDLDFNIWSPLAVIRCGPKVLPRFALHFIRSRNFQEAVQLGWSFGTQQNIGMGVIGNLSIAVPPIEEQLEIVKALDDFSTKADDLIRESRKGIELLGERKQALIAAGVTGKIDVRGYVASTVQ